MGSLDYRNPLNLHSETRRSTFRQRCHFTASAICRALRRHLQDLLIIDASHFNVVYKCFGCRPYEAGLIYSNKSSYVTCVSKTTSLTPEVLFIPTPSSSHIRRPSTLPPGDPSPRPSLNRGLADSHYSKFALFIY
ncbi:hypothetical protein L596_016472 [Steinernema carpocapsae]|uniref:Uncharacterized protein n=1 Tax=Steinernema carpocapsae TaxID=34508 RepID=A0A4U5NJ43_STECR|nr:hypothetical protein L596_016472 [Steinernema carpocapsae]